MPWSNKGWPKGCSSRRGGSMKTTGWGLGLIALASSPIPLVAQLGAAGQVELGGYAALAKYDATSIGLAQKFGAGGRWGLFLTRVFSLEANGDYTVTRQSALGGATVNVARVGGTLLANTRAGVYLGGGYERLYYRGALSFDDDGYHAVLGDRLPLGKRT